MDGLKKFIRNPSQLEDREDLIFMTYNWYAGDFQYENEKDSLYHIFIFGITEKGQSVCLDVTDFTPFFYIKVPWDWNDSDMRRLKYALQRQLYNGKKHLLSAKLMKKKDINGFNGKKVFKYVRFVFDCEKMCKISEYVFKNKKIEGFENQKFTVYNTKTGPMLTFTHVQDILMAGWIKINHKKATIHSEEEISRCQLCYTTNWKNIIPLNDKNDIPPLVTLSFDLECYSYDGSFPDPNDNENQITQIGSGFVKENSDEVLKHVIVLGECNEVDGVIIEQCKTEEELLTKWVELVEKTDPDQFIGYNIDDFDWNYIWVRCEKLNLINVIERLSRLTLVPSEFKDDTMESKAYGVNSFRYISTTGILQIDLLHWFRKNKKLESYSLDFVSNKFLGEKKRPITPKQIFDMAGPSGTPEERKIIADYCAQDVFLPIRLKDQFNMVVNYIEMAKVTRVPIIYLIMRGETIKVHSQIAYEARKQDFLIPMAEKTIFSSFSGATVLSPLMGSYTSLPIGGLDFASLYPSIMIGHNLCPTTFVKNPKYDNLEDIEYNSYQWDGGNYKFVKNVEGLVPGILKSLWSGRKKVKKEMGAEFLKAKNLKEQNKLEEAKQYMIKGNVLNGKQLAIKISMNSIYGAFGSSSFSIPCKPISATVTFIGRGMIDHSKKCAEQWYDGSQSLKLIKIKEEKIETEKGDKIIKDLTVEDKLLTSTGHWKNVKNKIIIKKIVTDKGVFITL